MAAVTVWDIKEDEMNRNRKDGFKGAAIILILLLVFFGCDNDPGGGNNSNSGDGSGDGNNPGGGNVPSGINGFPETLIMGEPFDLRKVITIKLPEAPAKTFDDIIWAKNSAGNRFETTWIVMEDDMFIPVTFLDRVVVYAVVKDGEGKGFDFVKSFPVKIVFPLNPFIGSWSGSDGKTWTFRTDGTYSINSAANDGSFAVWSGKPGRKFLITVSGDPDTITVQSVTSRTNGLYTPYCFEQSGNTITITPIKSDYDADNKQDPQPFDKIGTPITLTRQSGAPAVLDLSGNEATSMMIGEWSAGFYNTAFIPGDSANKMPEGTLIYYADGRVTQNNDYEGAWLKRGAVFITAGNDGRRWDPAALATWSKMTATAGEISGKEVVLISEYRTGNPGTPYSRGTNTALYWRLIKEEG
jgi:hypothetical protein